MKSSASTFMLAACATAFVATACNTILDNSSADLMVDAGDATGPTPDSIDATTPDATIAFDDGTPDSGTTQPTGDASACSGGEKSCLDECVSVSDPAYGCGAPACTPCAAQHATATCAGTACAVGTCDPGYADCDGKAENGCETDLSLATSCGTCNSSCGAAAPDCVPIGASFQCTTGCTPSAPTLCGTQCADLSTSVDHCGDCNTACAAVAHATVDCTAGACTFTCKTGMANCDGSEANGCEAALATDPKNCGACGNVCPGTACQSGVCASPPPPKDAGAPPQDSGTTPQDSGTTSPSDAAAD